MSTLELLNWVETVEGFRWSVNNSQSYSKYVVVMWLAEMSRAQWAIDDVVIAFNDSADTGFEEDFSNWLQPDVWYMAMNAVPRITCQSRDNALEFSKNGLFYTSIPRTGASSVRSSVRSSSANIVSTVSWKNRRIFTKLTALINFRTNMKLFRLGAYLWGPCACPLPPLEVKKKLYKYSV